MITVKTPSRLHFGLLDLSGNLGRIYGGLGVALERPPTVVEIRASDELFLSGENSSLVKFFVKKFSQHYRLHPKVEITVKKTIPQHQGLGSGTQLALAVACGLAKIHDIPVRIREFSQIMGRGEISAIGTAAFERGGFIIDGGKKIEEGDFPPITFQDNFPPEWHFVVVIPQGKGLHSEKEKQAFKEVIPGDPGIAQEICRLVQMKLLPSLREKDLNSFGEALTEIDRKGGLYFKDVQEGLYRENITEELVNFMLESGAKGAGQSSWGPGVYSLLHASQASKFKSKVEEFLKNKGVKSLLYQSKANNKGAQIISS